MSTKTTKSELLKGAISSGVINGIVNGLIYWFQVKDKKEILLTDNLISSTEHTVFAGAVPLATSLSFILSSIAYFTLKAPGKPPYFPKVFLLALKNAIVCIWHRNHFRHITAKVCRIYSCYPGYCHPYYRGNCRTGWRSGEFSDPKRVSCISFPFNTI